jgi:hypothetical protein
MVVTFTITDDEGQTFCTSCSLAAAIQSLADAYGIHAEMERFEGISDLHVNRAAPVLAQMGFTLRQVVAE